MAERRNSNPKLDLGLSSCGKGKLLLPLALDKLAPRRHACVLSFAVIATMSQTGLGTVAQPPDVDVDESIVIDDDESEPASGTKRKRAGRKPSDAWGTFQRIPNPNAASTKRAHNGVCNFCKHVVPGKVEDLRKHAATCTESNPDAKLAARIQQIKAGGGSATSSQMSVASYTDKHKLSAGQNKVMQRLLLLVLIMGGAIICFCGQSPVPALLTLPTTQLCSSWYVKLFLLCTCFSQVSTCPLSAGQTMLRGSLLDGLYCEVLVQHAAWLADEKLAKHLTLFIDGWSNARMESIYAICVMFPDRRAILLDALDLSSLTHSAENIAGALQTYLHAESVMPVKNVSTHACRDCRQDHEPIWAQEVHWNCYRQCP